MSNPISYYTSLVTSQYANSPKFLAWLTALLSPLDDCSNVTDMLVAAFDIDNQNETQEGIDLEQGGGPLITETTEDMILADTGCYGAQLDIIGQIVGQSRIMTFQPSNGISPILGDEIYRMLLKAKIAQNQWDGRLSSILPIWANLFPGGSIKIQDNQNMTTSVFLSGTFSSIILDLIINGLIVPRPEGVLCTYSFGTLPYFGWDLENQYVAGYDVGSWA